MPSSSRSVRPRRTKPPLTAFGAAALRAAHQSDPNPIFVDPLAARILKVALDFDRGMSQQRSVQRTLDGSKCPLIAGRGRFAHAGQCWRRVVKEV